MKTTEQCQLEWNGDSRGALATARMTLELLNHMAE